MFVHQILEKVYQYLFKNPTLYLKNRIAHTTEDEILRIIFSLDDSNSTGPSSIPVRLLKIAAHYVS